MSELALGRTIGRYTLLGAIGSGGMASVHLARLGGAAGFARTVALKRLRPELANDPEFVTMLTDEARTTARIVHPNVVATLDLVTLEGEAGAPGEIFLVMEYVHGESLAQLLANTARAGRRVPVDVAAAIVHGALLGLHAAHEATDEAGVPLEIVHRDLSPHNVLVDDRGHARVLDFGVAKSRGRQQVSRVGVLKGKVAYMAPEQVHGTVSRRSDLFSMGVVLWQTLTGERLFHGESDGEILAAILLAKAAPPSAKNADVPAALDRVTLRSLSRAPEDRYPTAQEFADDLAASVTLATPSAVATWLRQEAGPALAEREKMVRAEIPPEPTKLDTPAPKRPPRARRAVALAVAAALAIGLFLVARASLRAGAPPPVAAAASPSDSVGSAPIATVPEPEPSADPDPAPSADPKAPPRRPPPRARGVNCNPPYTLDEKGRKLFKRECF